MSNYWEPEFKDNTQVINFFKFLYDKRGLVPPTEIALQLVPEDSGDDYLAKLFKYPEVLLYFDKYLETEVVIESPHGFHSRGENDYIVIHFSLNIPKEVLKVHSYKIIFKELVRTLRKADDDEKLKYLEIDARGDDIHIDGAYILWKTKKLHRSRYGYF